MEQTEPILRPDRAAPIIGVSVGTLARWRQQGVGPPFVKMLGAVGYIPSDLFGWIAERRRTSTADVRVN